jgi:hypothetical protein
MNDSFLILDGNHSVFASLAQSAYIVLQAMSPSIMSPSRTTWLTWGSRPTAMMKMKYWTMRQHRMM